ncbi:MAG: thioredoxin family protein [Candidatus Riflebacteria bacterium]|nr:thioredoxin family protein [Candidatus Riflebacteria bacterium]
MKLNNFSYIFVAASLFFSSGCGAAPETSTPAQPTAQTSVATAANDANALKLPRIIDFGSKQCKACKAMEPVLESLAKNHADKFKTEFIDVWIPENESFAKEHSIESIPTQVFLNAEDKEVFRHTGFISEEDVLAKWAELGLITVSGTNEEANPESVAPKAASETTEGE